ncbi:fatty-acid synthase [Bifidobacterium goeldii]|uniref:Fatty-acid synthase n=1 Tax=Bifidobacterium goeldii TaxID=2306975 RepID=A0A430FD86_9BIFI|nr:type I polyketide synthase [Bifidobacterium goeldii]RSX50787.1 fatty-acid synthase [Bifidobacterium goeldii]
MTQFFLNRLNTEPHALAFAGQSTPWPVALADLTADPTLESELKAHVDAANTMLAPVAADLLATTGRSVDLFAFTPNPAKLGAAAAATVSVEGIALTQLGALIDATRLGFDIAGGNHVAVLGHSQGILGVHMVNAITAAGSISKAAEQINEILATAALIGVAGTRKARELALNAQHAGATPMLSVRGATRRQVEALAARVPNPRGPITIAVTNSADNHVLSGYPEDLAAFEVEAGKEHKRQQTLRDNKVRGGAVFNPVLEYLEVTLPFHSPLMADAVEQTVAWAAACGFDETRARELASEVLLNHVDWAARVKTMLDSVDPATLWIVDFGPGNTLGKLVDNLIQGTGVGVVEASTMADRAALSTLEGEPERTQNWKAFAPRVLHTPAGDKILTKFSKLTGKPPVLLPGMTPTTVDPEIVAAAANAGYWAELAGGGQVTADVFDRHVAELEDLLEEGRTVEFNAMFMDRYLWNLQFGSTRIVPKKRASGAPIDGVIVSAGIPEVDEAKALVASLVADGLPYVGFKPGTVEQIRQVVRIAKAVAPTPILMQVEGGAAGGHHSWESLDDLLTSTYAQVRACDNLVLVAGGGIGTPERAADYISGQWARAYGLPDMPVDGVLVGTAVMTAKEAHTSPAVKQLLVDTPGITASSADDASADPFAPAGEAWVPSGKSVGGVASGLSHLHADIYEVENSSAVCGRLLVRVMKHPEELESRRDEIIQALNATAKPYFGDLAAMTYVEWAQRFAELSFPWVDPTYALRFLHLLQRIEARVTPQDNGEFTSLFADVTDVDTDPQAAIARLRDAYPQAATLHVTPADVAWFPVLVREYPKPMPFVPVIDNDLLRWWGQDQLWQSEDARYSADSVRVIPGPIAVAGITTIDEPVADILGRFETAALERTRELQEEANPQQSEQGEQAVSELGGATSVEEFIRRSPNISWVGHLTHNPAYGTAVGDPHYEIRAVDEQAGEYDLDIHLDTYWDNDPDGGLSKHAVRDIVVPLTVCVSETGLLPVVNRDRLVSDVYAMLAATAGIGNTAITGDKLEAMPQVEAAASSGITFPQSAALAASSAEGAESEGAGSAVAGLSASEAPFGVVRAHYTLSANLGYDHEAVTGGALPASLAPSRIAPDALVGPAWPAIYAALGSVQVNGYPVIEGLLNAVHLDHLIELEENEDALLAHVGETVSLTAWAEQYFESASGRVVTIHVTHTAADGTVLARETERFAIRGRVYSDALPANAPDYGDWLTLNHDSEDAKEAVSRGREAVFRGREADGSVVGQSTGLSSSSRDSRLVQATARRLLRRVRVVAPSDMTAFARTSGDFNPIHTSVRGARISGLAAPLVHGMWLSATAQHAVQALDDKGAHYEIAGWTYNMYGMVQLGDTVEISVERVGKVAHAGMALEVTCRIDGQIVSRGTALVRAPRAAFVYPGQGIQSQGMVLDERVKSPAARDVWERADKLTRERLGFSILALVRDNPKELTANGVTYRHPEGLLNLTQFTQVALATVAYAQTARLREAGCDIWPAYFAGHSLGEYNALSAFAGIIPLETELELVFHRGSTMHHLIERDAQGRSNYRMGALRPNQFGVGDDGVKAYVDSVAKQCGEFLQIVNYNLAGAQYAVAGTIAGLKALQEDANRRAREYGGKPAFMLVPGIDVPFHSTLLRKGVPEFRDKLDALLPQHIDYRGRLVGRYIPNLVAAPFEMTREFAAKILEVVPSERIREALDNPAVWDSYAADDQKLGRLLLTELLSWQFASPVRWIETQALLFNPVNRGGLGVEEYVEVGLGKAPTLANLGAKTLRMPDFSGCDVTVYNVGRDEGRVYMTDTDSLAPQTEDDVQDQAAASAASAPSASSAPSAEGAVSRRLTGGASAAQAADNNASAEGRSSSATASSSNASPMTLPQSATQTAASASAAAATAVSQLGSAPTGPVDDLPFHASDAIGVLMAYSAKVRLDQIGVNDTTDTLTNGVSSRRNQLLMDISSELGVASVDGAAEATLTQLAQIVNKAAPNYKPFGPVLSDAIRDRLRALFGAAGVKPAHIRDRVTGVWQLGEGWVAAVTAALLLDTREGASSRGGDLAKLPTGAAANAAAADKLIDDAVTLVGQTKGVAVSKPSAGGAAGGAVVDSAALDAFAAQVTGADGVLASTARFVLNELGVTAPAVDFDADEAARNAAVVDAVTAELGADWPKQVEPRFDANKAMLFDDRWASAREDLARAFYDANPALLDGSFRGLGKAIAAEAQWFANHVETVTSTGDAAFALKTAFSRIANEALQVVSDDAAASRFANDIAVVTGVAPNSIAAQVVCGLLAGGATVIATSHSFKPSVKAWAKQAYREHAAGSAQLWLVPANLSSYRDVDELVSWIGNVQKKTSGATTTIVKPAYEPTLFFPFAAPPVHGTMADSGELFESQARLMLWGVERAITGLAAIGSDTDVQHKLHVVLPGSPNRGIFGGDGAYGEVKSAFDAIVNRAHAERVWSNRVTFAHPKIGWVRGTGLMGGNDPLVEVVERHGIHTYSTAQIAVKLLDLCTAESRAAAANAPLNVDLTGGLGNEPIDIKALRAEAEADAARAAGQETDGSVVGQSTGLSSSSRGLRSGQAASAEGAEAAGGQRIKALPTPNVPTQPAVDLADWANVTARPEDEIVIVSIGELGPWGSGRTRFEAELGIHHDGHVDLSAGAVLELAWNMGLLTWQDSPKPGWYDTDGNLVPEEDIHDRYHDEVVARSGIRPFDNGMGGDYQRGGADGNDARIGTDEEEAEVYLDHDVVFSVPTEDIAREYVKLDEAHTTIAQDTESGEWAVTRHAGSMIRVPRRATMTRTVGGQFPTGFDPTRWGIPASMVGDVDEIALWNIVTTVDAYLSAGFTPVEILQAIHPSLVASTQGTGFGGMKSMRKLYLDRFLNHEIPTDILQEALPNVVAAHVMQSYIGGYGNMIQPVSACATAAVSLEEGFDKIKLGKADFVVTGAIDDIGVESVIGFGNMNATANSEEMYAKGINPRFFSRANDRRRGGFLESQGGGTILLTRGDIAARLGLPVAGVIGYVHSFADGAHTSIPAPGLGALAAGLGGRNSKLVRDLAALGVTPDDIAVVSKHDTSTNANDPNESELHNTLAHAIGRTDGNPLFVISQKTLTGHAKGGACVFQVNGLTQLFGSGVIPANVSLDCVDPKLQRDDHMVWLTKPLHVGSVKAGLATSLGFGHVSGFAAIVNPGAFEAALAHSDGEAALEAWRSRANARLAAGQRRLEEGMMGRAALYEPIEGRRFRKDGTKLPDGSRYNAHEVEKAMLLDPNARLGASGFYEA